MSRFGFLFIRRYFLFRNLLKAKMKAECKSWILFTYNASLKSSDPGYSGRYSDKLDILSFSLKRSILLKNTIKGVCLKKMQFKISPKSFSLSRILNKRDQILIVFRLDIHLFVKWSSDSTWLKSLREIIKSTEVTLSKHWIHFFRSDLWPPTSTSSNLKSLL